MVAMIRATCDECGFKGTLLMLELHDCTIEQFGGHCEDYPCCGHTYGECQNRPEYTSEYYLANPALTHLGCDHETGYCNYEEYVDEDEMEDADA